MTIHSRYKQITEEKPINLKNIAIKGFKSISDVDLPMKKINILIGANGSGKTNLISVFTFLNHLSRGNLKNYIMSRGGANRFFHFGIKTTSKIVMDLKIGINGYHVSFVPNHSDDSLAFDEEICTIETSGKLHPLTPLDGESGFVTCDNNDRVIMHTKNYLNKCRIYHFHDTSIHANYKKKQTLFAKDDNNIYLEADAGNIAPFMYSLKKSKLEEFNNSYQDIVSAIKVVAPFFHDFYLEPEGETIILKWIHSKNDNPLSANTLSDGTARFIFLAALILQPASLMPGTIILDEPELGLHPAALEVFADTVRSVSDETQFICSTQSIALANLFGPEDFIVVDAENGISTFRRLEKESLIHWLDEYRMGDIWSKNLIGGRPAW